MTQNFPVEQQCVSLLFVLEKQVYESILLEDSVFQDWCHPLINGFSTLELKLKYTENVRRRQLEEHSHVIVRDKASLK